MNVIDYAIIGIFILSSLIGIMRGLTKEVLSLFSWVGSIAATFMFWPLARHIARQYISHPMMADGATILCLFVLFLVMFSLISYFISNLVSSSFLGGIDKSLGLLFGVIRGAVIICLLELVISCFVIRPNHPSIIKDSRFSALVYRGSDIMFHILPTSIQDFITQQQAKYGLTPGETEKTVNKVTAEAVRQALPPLIENSKQKVEDIAGLKPKVAETNETKSSYTKKNKVEMERLLKEEALSENQPEPNETSTETLAKKPLPN